METCCCTARQKRLPCLIGNKRQTKTSPCYHGRHNGTRRGIFLRPAERFFAGRKRLPRLTCDRGDKQHRSLVAMTVVSRNEIFRDAKYVGTRDMSEHEIFRNIGAFRAGQPPRPPSLDENRVQTAMPPSCHGRYRDNAELFVLDANASQSLAGDRGPTGDRWEDKKIGYLLRSAAETPVLTHQSTTKDDAPKKKKKKTIAFARKTANTRPSTPVPNPRAPTLPTQTKAKSHSQ